MLDGQLAAILFVEFGQKSDLSLFVWPMIIIYIHNEYETCTQIAVSHDGLFCLGVSLGGAEGF